MSVTNKALFVIERNLRGELSLEHIAADCHISRFHLAHAFVEAIGRSVMDYVRARRLSEAAYALAAGVDDILGLALDCGYSSHEAFSRAFKAQFGRTPDEVRRLHSVDGLSLVDAVRHVETSGMTLQEPRFETAGELKFVGMGEHIAYDNVQRFAALWREFMGGPYHQIANRKEEPPVGINTGADDTGTDYMCAAEVTAFGAIPRGLTALTVLPATYAVFSHDGHVTQLTETYKAIWNDWFPGSGKMPAEVPALQRHNATFDPRTGEGGVTVWIPVKECGSGSRPKAS